MKRIFATAAVMLACGASPTRTPSQTPQTLPGASSETPKVDADPRSCDRIGPVITSARDEPPAPAVVAGQMTEQAARAKRLFDSERWSEAERALASVAHGESGDDAGNVQLAQYHLAIVIYRQKDFRRSYAIFSEMARNRAHMKHAETLLWLTSFLTEYADLVDFADFASYTADDVARFNNANQRDVFSAASFALGRERLQEGARAEAQAFFARVDPSGPFGELAAHCSERTR